MTHDFVKAVSVYIIFCLANMASSAEAQENNDDDVTILTPDLPASAIEPLNKQRRIIKPQLSGAARLRYNYSEDGLAVETGNALTLRAVATLQAEILPKTSILIEGEGVLEVIGDFNNGTGNRPGFPVIPDVEGIELNRAQLVTEIIPNTRITLGRQRIVYDDGRFIGDVFFRQNNQTFDAIRGRLQLPGTAFIDGAYINKALRPLGNDNPAGRFRGDSYVLNANFQTPLGRVITYHYALDLSTADTPPFNGASNKTTGAQLSGRRNWDDKGLIWDVAYARQSDFADNLNDYEADYGLVSLRGEVGGFNLTGRAEVLGGSDVQGFQTPLATLHRFQGFADRFLLTPAAGVEDLSVQAGYKFGNIGPFKDVRAFARHHWFSAARGDLTYGTELDAQLRFTMNNISIFLDYADYRANNFSADTQQVFLTISQAF
jgi:hypothetical protein